MKVAKRQKLFTKWREYQFTEKRLFRKKKRTEPKKNNRTFAQLLKLISLTGLKNKQDITVV